MIMMTINIVRRLAEQVLRNNVSPVAILTSACLCVCHEGRERCQIASCLQSKGIIHPTGAATLGCIKLFGCVAIAPLLPKRFLHTHAYRVARAPAVALASHNAFGRPTGLQTAVLWCPIGAILAPAAAPFGLHLGSGGKGCVCVCCSSKEAREHRLG